MNKVLIIALITIVSNSAFAKTKVFGELHASYSNKFPVGIDVDDTFTLHNSVVGVKGSHEIRKDVSFIYQFAWGVSDDGFDGYNDQGINNRNQVIGLASPKGAVIIGRFDTPFKTVGRKADLFWHSQLGQNRNITNASTWDLRADKVIVLQSPKKNGLQSSIAYASDISDTSRLTENASAASVNTFYKKGKFRFGAAYEHHNLKDNSSNRDALRLSAVYKTGPLKLVGFYQKEDNAQNFTFKADADVLGVGIAYRRGKGTWKAQLYNRNIDSTSKDPRLLAVGYDYKVTKKLDFYAQAAEITKGAVLSQSEYSTSKDRGIAVGVRYKF